MDTRTVGTFGYGFHTANRALFLKRNRHWTLIVRQRCPVGPVQFPRATPVDGSQLRTVAPEIGCSFIVVGNTSSRVSHIERGWQRVQHVLQPFLNLGSTTMGFEMVLKANDFGFRVSHLQPFLFSPRTPRACGNIEMSV